MDNLAIEFVLSTNGDDPANIKKDPQEDVKPRMTQSRLGSVLNNPRTSTPALAGAAPPAPRASSTPGPSMSRAKNGNEKVPLFQPEEEDDDHSAIQGEKGASADDDDEMWAEMDNEDPAFSQVALELTQSQSTRAADHQNGRPSTHDAEMTMSPEPDRKRARTASTALPSQGLQGSTQENAISLDDEESGDNEEDVKPMSSLPKPSGKKGKKVRSLGNDTVFPRELTRTCCRAGNLASQTEAPLPTYPLSKTMSGASSKKRRERLQALLPLLLLCKTDYLSKYIFDFHHQSLLY